MTTIADILATTPLEVKTGDQAIEEMQNSYGYFIPELGDYFCYHRDSDDERDCSLIETHEFHHHTIDYRRYHSIFGVKFDGEWVMLCQKAGREGEDHTQRYVLNSRKLGEMITYIRLNYFPIETTEETPLDYDGDDLLTFYGHTHALGERTRDFDY